MRAIIWVALIALQSATAANPHEGGCFDDAKPFKHTQAYLDFFEVGCEMPGFDRYGDTCASLETIRGTFSGTWDNVCTMRLGAWWMFNDRCGCTSCRQYACDCSLKYHYNGTTQQIRELCPATCLANGVFSQRCNHGTLGTIFEATGGANWKNKNNWMTGDPCQWPKRKDGWNGVICEGSFDGAPCEETSDKCNISPVRLALSDNNLMGSLPTDLGLLASLTHLDISQNKLSGTLPTSLRNLANLTVLDLRNNLFAYPTNASMRDDYNLATQRCRSGRLRCLGIPPESCSAFANVAQSLTDPTKCTVCDGDNVVTTIILAGSALLALLALLLFVRLAIRHPQSLKRWVSTVTILVNQAQALILIRKLHLEWPYSVELILSALSFK